MLPTISLLLTAIQIAANAATRPHIVAVLADDLGWYDTQIYNPNSPTPHLKALSDGGLRLDRHYVFRFCSPTRRSFLTGRLPTAITTVQPDGGKLCSDFLPLAATLISEKLSAVGYDCHFIGKGHLGYQTSDHLPVQRGFRSHVGYLGGSEGYKHGGGNVDSSIGSHDLWDGLGPSVDGVADMFYSTNYYTAAAVAIIEEVSASRLITAPHFMYLAYQNVHDPYTLPPDWEAKDFPSMGQRLHVFANMLALLDDGVRNVTSALRRAGMWESTLLLFSADNGAIGQYGNNYPLRGHKHDPWEGGTRVTAFLAGGALPSHIRGTASGEKLVYVADWYATFCNLAGASAADDVEIGGKIRSIDSVDVWPLLVGTNGTQPRPLTVITEVSAIEVVEAARSVATASEARGTRAAAPAHLWKLITLAGESNYYSEDGNQTDAPRECLSGRQPDPPQPGRTDPIVNGPAAHEHADPECPVCNTTRPCLFDLLADPSETINVASSHPDVVRRLAEAIDAANAGQYVNGTLDASVLEAKYDKLNTTKQWGGFLGPCFWRRGDQEKPPPSPPCSGDC